MPGSTSVAAVQHLVAEQPVEGHARGEHRHLPVVQPVGEYDQAQRRRLVGDGPDIGEADRAQTVGERPVPARMDLREVLEEMREVVEGRAFGGVRGLGDLLVGVGGGASGSPR